MKTIIFFLSLILVTNITYSQSIRCSELKEILEVKAELVTSSTCFGSTALVKAEYYTSNGEGYAIVYLKSNEYDISGKPYVFCGISNTRWNKFVSEGRYGSWGKAFNTYIRDYLCNCQN